MIPSLGQLMADPGTGPWMNLALYGVLFAALFTTIGRVISGKLGWDQKHGSSMFGMIGLIIGMMFSFALPAFDYLARLITPGLFAVLLFFIGAGCFWGVRSVTKNNNVLALFITLSIVGGIWYAAAESIDAIAGVNFPVLSSLFGVAVAGVSIYFLYVLVTEFGLGFTAAGGGSGSAFSRALNVATGLRHRSNLSSDVKNALKNDPRAEHVAQQAANMFDIYRAGGATVEEARRRVAEDINQQYGVSIIAGAPAAAPAAPAAKGAVPAGAPAVVARKAVGALNKAHSAIQKAHKANRRVVP